jgi:hypothetical protein
MTGVRFLVGARDLSLLHSVEVGSGVHPASHLLDTGDHSLEVKGPGREAGSLTSI